MSYKSPIDLCVSHMNAVYEDSILKAVQKVGVSVDKEELLKALSYDRYQYDKGFNDAREIYEKALDMACTELAIKQCILYRYVESPNILKEHFLKRAKEEVKE